MTQRGFVTGIYNATERTPMSKTKIREIVKVTLSSKGKGLLQMPLNAFEGV